MYDDNPHLGDMTDWLYSSAVTQGGCWERERTIAALKTSFPRRVRHRSTSAKFYQTGL